MFLKSYILSDLLQGRRIASKSKLVYGMLPRTGFDNMPSYLIDKGNYPKETAASKMEVNCTEPNPSDHFYLESVLPKARRPRPSKGLILPSETMS